MNLLLFFVLFFDTDMPGCSNLYDKLSFFAWNINGVSSNSLGDKLRNTDFLRMIDSFDFIILSETWKRISVDVDGFTMVTTGAVKTGKCGRNSGGLALLYRSKLNDWISILKGITKFLMV